MSGKVACLAPPNSRSIMSGFPNFPQANQLSSPGDHPTTFPQQLLMAGWPDLLSQQPQQHQAGSKELEGGVPTRSDVQLRRDTDISSGGLAAGLLGTPAGLGIDFSQYQLQQHHLAGSSGPGSDAGGSGQHQALQEEAAKPAKRGRGRQRKNTGVETAQQRAHRRFYERKKQRMAALEQEAREKQEEYNHLLSINTELRRKHEALERAVAGRDEHLILIQALDSLSLDAGRAHPQQQHHQPTLPTVPEQQAQQQQQLMPPPPARAPQQQQQQAGQALQQQQQQQPGRALDPSPQPPPAELMPQVEEAGPFGLIQLPQYGSAEADALPAAGPSQQQQPAGAGAVQQQMMSWAAEDDDLPLPAVQLQHDPQQQQQQQAAGAAWPAGGFLDLLESQGGMSLTRSLSMPARTGGFDADLLCPAREDAMGPGGAWGGLGPAAGAGQGSRSFSTTPGAWPSRAGALRMSSQAAAGMAGAEGDWELGRVFAAAAAAREGDLQAAPLLPPGSSRHHSWSGASAGDSMLPGGLLPKASLSFGAGLGPVSGAAGTAQDGGAPAGSHSGQQAGGAGRPSSSHAGQLPAAAQLPGGLDFAAAVGAAVSGEPAAAAAGGGLQQEPKAWLQHLQQQQQQQQQQPQEGDAADAQLRGVWGTVTTAGPLLAPEPCQQQLPAASTSFAGFQPAPWPQQPQQLQEASAFAMPPPPRQAPQLQPRRSALQQPEPQQVVQQLQQMGDMAFGNDLAMQLGAADMPDDVVLFDDDDMLDMLMERMSHQQSIEMLSPLPSIPSALLTGDSLRHAMAADPHFMAGYAAANSPPGAHARAGAADGAAQQQQQQQQGAAHMPAVPEPAAEADAAAAAGQHSPPGPISLLEASMQLQARHMAAGFYPSRGANEMFYVHEMVDWYKSKLQQLQQLLPYVDRPNPDVPCSLSLVQTMEEVIDGVRKFGTRNRIGMWEMRLINLETGDFEEAAPSHWAMVAEHIQLPAQMRESAIACYSLYLEYVEKVKADRIAILQDFQLLEQQLDAAGAATTGSGIAPPTLLFRVDGHEEYHALLERLQLSLKREHMVANMLSYSLSQISSHVQMAKGMLSCWPYWPDGPSVLSFWLADEQARGPARPAAAAAAAGVGGGASAGPVGL